MIKKLESGNAIVISLLCFAMFAVLVYLAEVE